MLRHRDSGTELLDRPDCDPVLAAKSYRFMKVVNRFGGGTRVVRRFLAREIARSPLSRPARVLDFGSGTCDIPLAVARWAARRGHQVEITCIEQNPRALDMARQAVAHARCNGIKLILGDVFTHQPTEPYDYAVGSMVIHHFGGQEISRLIAHLAGFVTRALLINDLRRCALNYAACYALTLTRDPLVRHDALLSIRRGFKPDDLLTLVNTGQATATVSAAWFCRVAAIVRFDKEASP
jgi:SAM-dependent methyltransferase